MLSNVLTVILFYWYCWGFGHTAIELLKLKIESIPDSHIMKVGTGLGVMVMLGVLLNLVHIPIRWWIFLVLSLIYPVYSLIQHIKSSKLISDDQNSTPKLKKGFFIPMEYIFLFGVLLMYAIMNFVYISGSMNYPYLEDGDSYRNLAEAYMIKETGSFTWGDKPFATGVEEPYPQGYHIIMGVLLQTASSWQTLIKIINSTIISLSVVFFYLFVKKWTKNDMIGFFAAFCLFVIPSFMTHFIWATSLSLTLFFPAFYAVESTKDDKKWIFIAGILIASVLCTQITTSLAFGVLFIVYMLVKETIERHNSGYIFLAGVLGVALAALLFYFPSYFSVGGERYLMQFGFGENLLSPFSPHQTGGEAIYTLNDFLLSPPYGKIDNTIGIGPVLSLIFLGGLAMTLSDTRRLFKEKNTWTLIVVVWFIISFIGVNGARLPISLFPHRLWAIMAIPVCVLAGSTFYYFWRYLHKTKFHPLIPIFVFMLLILATSGYSKYKINTSIWGWGAGIRQHPDEMKGYLYLMQLPIGTKVYPVCAPTYLPVGFDKGIDWWNEDIIYKSRVEFEGKLTEEQANRYNLTRKLVYEPPSEAYEWLASHDFEYIIIDGNCVELLGNQTGVVFDSWLQTGKFAIAFRTEATVLLEVK